jgi:hypothetical protein
MLNLSEYIVLTWLYSRRAVLLYSSANGIIMWLRVVKEYVTK